MSEHLPRAARRCPSCGARMRGAGRACDACGAALPWRLTLGGALVETVLAIGISLVAIAGLLWWRAGGRAALPDGGALRELVSEAPTDVPSPPPATPAPPTRPPSTPSPPTATPLPEVVEHAIASGDTLFGLGLEYGVTLDEIRAANPEIEALDRLQIGQVIRIPLRQPAAPDASAAAVAEAAPVEASEAPATTAAADAADPVGAAPDAEADAAALGARADDEAAAATAMAIVAPTGEPITVTAAETHTVVAGDTLGALAAAYDTPLDDLVAWNGLADPNENLPLGAALVVRPEVVVTATPRPVPTRMAAPGDSGGSAAALPMDEARGSGAPTFAAPLAIAPAHGAVVTGDPPLLRWASSGVLPAGVSYVVAIRDDALPSARPRLTWVRGSGTALRLPPRWRPAVGASRTIAWSVTVRRPSSGLLASDGLVLSGEPVWQTFVWTPRGDATAEATE